MLQLVPFHRSTNVAVLGLSLVANPPTAVQDDADGHETPRRSVTGLGPGGTAGVSRFQRRAAATPCVMLSKTTVAVATASSARNKRAPMLVPPPLIYPDDAGSDRAKDKRRSVGRAPISSPWLRAAPFPQPRSSKTTK